MGRSLKHRSRRGTEGSNLVPSSGKSRATPPLRIEAMARASSTSMPRYLTVLSIFVCPKEWASYYASPFSLKIKGPLRTVRC